VAPACLDRSYAFAALQHHGSNWEQTGRAADIAKPTRLRSWSAAARAPATKKAKVGASRFGGPASRRRSTKRTQLGSGSSTRTAAVRVCDCAIVRGQTSPNSRPRCFSILMRIQSALEQAGIVFLDSDASGGVGVRLKKESPQGQFFNLRNETKLLRSWLRPSLGSTRRTPAAHSKERGRQHKAAPVF